MDGNSVTAFVTILVVAVVLLGGTVIARRRGYRIGGETVVRCNQGHLFTTIWIPGGSLKAIRLGWIRIQYCPVGDHLAFVMPVKEEDLTDAERRMAARYHDTRMP